MMTAYSYAYSEYPGMEACPSKFQAETEAELWQLLEIHGKIAHGEDASDWSDDERGQIQALIKIKN